MPSRPHNSRNSGARRLALPTLDQRLTLVTWFADQMGYSSNLKMLEDLRESSEDWIGDRHPVLRRAINRGKVKIPEDALSEMNDNIRIDLEAINRHRTPQVSLKYFQYLSVLATENFLRLCSTRPGNLVQELQEFASDRDDHGRYPAPESVADLNKLALWAATGAGKTLLMHLNYRQFLRRRKSGLFVPDSVILLTPNETLSNQHIAEMQLSGIPCCRLQESANKLGLEGNFPVRVVEITKFTPRSKGVTSISLDEFEGRNLLLVDEGHKGASGNTYFAVRDKLAERGFVMEYSATYGQAINSKNFRTEEYARSIVFDYSYRHFHSDGYGKEFDVINLDGNKISSKKQDALMLGNLLVFLQQRMCFVENREEFLRHNLEPPLMLMLGAKVTGGTSDANIAKITEIMEFLEFLHRISQNNDWLEKAITDILTEGIKDSANQNIFAARLDWLRSHFETKKEINVKAVCRALQKNVLLTDSPGALNFCPVRGAKGEAALRVGNSTNFFALIYVGDVINKLREKVKEYAPGIQTTVETLASGPMFPSVGRADSPITILIGAKKFMEGWSSWRVSGMGMLNVGISEGPQVIQLFGRGVRLKGAGMSLKRGGGDNPPKYLSILETMNIFGVRANFISQFRKMLEQEGVWEETIHLPVSPPLQKGLSAGLQIPEYPEKEFTKPVLLDTAKNIRVVIDLSSSVLRIASAEGDTGNVGFVRAPAAKALSDNALAIVDRDELHRQLQEYRVRAGLWNMVFPLDNLPEILRSHCVFICDADSPLEPISRRDIRRIRDAAIAAMRKYTQKFYNIRRGAWELERIEYQSLKSEHPNFRESGGDYILRIPQKEKEIIGEIRKLINDQKKIGAMWASSSSEWQDPPPRVYLSSHLYQPLLLTQALQRKKIHVSPPALNDGEVDFVNKLQQYLKTRPPQASEEVFLLRNQSQTGLGFHGEFGGIYPDFILWIKRGKKQRIVFIEPHGMVFADAYDEDPKARLYDTLKPVIHKLADEHPDVEMDAFVISQTPYGQLHKKYGEGWEQKKFTQCHILFADDDYITRIFDWN